MTCASKPWDDYNPGFGSPATVIANQTTLSQRTTSKRTQSKPFVQAVLRKEEENRAKIAKAMQEEKELVEEIARRTQLCKKEKRN